MQIGIVYHSLNQKIDIVADLSLAIANENQLLIYLYGDCERIAHTEQRILIDSIMITDNDNIRNLCFNVFMSGNCDYRALQVKISCVVLIMCVVLIYFCK